MNKNISLLITDKTPVQNNVVTDRKEKGKRKTLACWVGVMNLPGFRARRTSHETGKTKSESSEVQLTYLY